MRADDVVDRGAALGLVVPPQAEAAGRVGAPATILGDGAATAGDAIARQAQSGRSAGPVGDDDAPDQLAAQHQRRERLIEALWPEAAGEADAGGEDRGGAA